MTAVPPPPAGTLLTGRVVTPDRVVADGAVVVRADRVRYAGPRSRLPGGWRAMSAPDGWQHGSTLLPGLVDIHCHGGHGAEFGDDREAALAAARFHHRSGSTTVVGSLVSAAAAHLLKATHTLAALVSEGDLGGLHLEGPFLSAVRRGAQDPAALTDPDLGLVEQLAEAAGPGTLAQMTFAPERPGADDVPGVLAAAGALGAVGHTDTDFRGARAAFDRVAELGVRGGLPLATHLFNGMPPLRARAPGPVGAALAAAARGEAVLEVIADGVHLDAGTVRMVYDSVGAHHMALVSDAMSAAGLADGTYTLGATAVEVTGREVRLADGGSLAGGVTILLDQLRWCVHELGIPLYDAVLAASTTPARALGLDDVGSLVSGAYADLVVVDDSLQLRRVMRRGRWLDG